MSIEIRPLPWLPPLAEEEYEAVAESICRRIQDGTMPPDDAYWWTRVLFADAVCTMMRQDDRSARDAAPATTTSCPAAS